MAASLLDRRKGKSDKPAKGSVAATLPNGLLDKLKARIDVDPTLARDQTPITAPSTGEVLGTTPMATESDVAAAISRARQAQVEWAQTPVKERAKILLRFHDLVLARRAEGVALIRAENGKSRRDAYEEILDTAGAARYYARTAEKHLKAKAHLGVLPLLTMAKEYRRPLGVVGLIVPWNYPLVLGVTDAIPALMAGNACVTKADRETPYSALWAATLLDEAGLPRDLFQVITGSGSELGGPIIDRVDYMMFTGSTATGKKVAEQCGARLIGYSMELGGKNALLVLDDADIDRTVNGAVRAAFSNAGQLCIHAERIFAVDSVYDAFATKFAARVNGMKLSTGDDSEMGSLISKKQLDTVTEHVADAVAKGATVLAGGKALPDVGPLFHQPTLLEGVEPGMTVYAEETFGPLVSLYRVKSEDEAIARANDSRYGLNFSVWTSSPSHGKRIADKLEAGTVGINDGYGAAWGTTHAPMGGVKESGVARRHGAYGIQKYTESQTVVVQRIMPPTGPGGRYQRLVEQNLVVGLKLLRRASFFRG